MYSVRTAVLSAGLLVALGAALAGAATLAAGCGDPPAAPVVAPSDVHLATGEPGSSLAAGAPSGAPRAALPGPPEDGDTTPSAGDRLEAARTVALYCSLIDSGQFARAAGVCARRRLCSRRSLAGVSGFRFRSARVYAAPDARTLVLKARVRVRAGRGCPLPDGLAVLFFTLGRAGTAVGGWLITAVSTHP